MVTKAKTPIDDDTSGDDSAFLLNEESEIEQTQDEALQDVLNQLDESEGTARVIVYRSSKDRGSNDSYCGEFTPGNFSLEEIRRKFGGGEYRVRVLGNRGRIKANKRINIEAIQNENINVAPVVAVQNTDKLAEIMANGFAQLGLMFQNQQNHQPPAPNRREMLDELLVFKQLFSGNENQQPAQTDPLTTFLKGVEFAKAVTPREPGATDSDVMMGLLDKFGPVIANAVLSGNNQQSNDNQNVPAIPAIPLSPAKSIQNEQRINTVDSVVTNNPTNNGDDMNVMQTAMLKQSLNFLCMKASSNSDPVLYADLVIDNIPEDQLTVFIGRNDWLSHLAVFEPKVKDYQEWFNQLKQAVTEVLTSPDGDDIPSITASNSTNNADNQSS